MIIFSFIHRVISDLTEVRNERTFDGASNKDSNVRKYIAANAPAFITMNETNLTSEYKTHNFFFD